jgi:hypothetical protein
MRSTHTLTHKTRDIGLFVFGAAAFVAAITATPFTSSPINSAAASNLETLGVEVSYITEEEECSNTATPKDDAFVTAFC